MKRAIAEFGRKGKRRRAGMRALGPGVRAAFRTAAVSVTPTSRSPARRVGCVSGDVTDIANCKNQLANTAPGNSRTPHSGFLSLNRSSTPAALSSPPRHGSLTDVCRLGVSFIFRPTASSSAYVWVNVGISMPLIQTGGDGGDGVGTTGLRKYRQGARADGEGVSSIME